MGFVRSTSTTVCPQRRRSGFGGRSYVKARHNALLRERIGLSRRSRGSVESSDPFSYSVPYNLLRLTQAFPFKLLPSLAYAFLAVEMIENLALSNGLSGGFGCMESNQ